MNKEQKHHPKREAAKTELSNYRDDVEKERKNSFFKLLNFFQIKVCRQSKGKYKKTKAAVADKFYTSLHNPATREMNDPTATVTLTFEEFEAIKGGRLKKILDKHLVLRDNYRKTTNGEVEVSWSLKNP